jgi:hypothetical protein
MSGRIYFKKLSIYSKEYSINVHKGYIQFRYWMSVTLEDDIDTDAEVISDKKTNWRLRVDGLEIFIYNRSEAYRNLDEILKANAIVLESSKNMFPSWLSHLHFYGSKSSIIIGNPDVTHLLTLSFDKISGLYSHHKISHVISVRAFLTPAKLVLGINVDYKEPTLNYAARVRAQRNVSTPFWTFVSSFVNGPEQTSVDIGMLETYQWAGLDRYRVFDGSSDHTLYRNKDEYAQVGEILQAESLEFHLLSEFIADELKEQKLELVLDTCNINYGP